MLGTIDTNIVSVPAPQLLQLPEQILQFGTGVLLRGLPDYFIDKANRQGLYNGRVMVVKSTAQGDTAAFDQQSGLYTLCIRGVEEGRLVEENHILSAISRVVNASTQWQEVLDLARSPQLEVILSNTTEVGIQLVSETLGAETPQSFPGKLLAVLLERYHALGGDAATGLVILPTELLPNNGKQLQAIVLELAKQNNLEPAFLDWLYTHNHFCNTLVDRIVPGKPDAATLQQLSGQLGYTDDLLIMAESYSLWAIEGGAEIQEKLSFAAADPGVVIAPDINRYRELKLRLLNGAHTLSCGLAFLAGCATVQEAMNDNEVQAYIVQLMQEELAPSIPYPVPLEEARAYGATVLDRFRNPHIRHQWLSITLNYSSKLKLRVVPVLLRHFEQYQQVPVHIALGFAAYLCFTKPAELHEGTYFGRFENNAYPIQDEQAGKLHAYWQNEDIASTVSQVLADTGLWGQDLSALPGFTDAVSRFVDLIQKEGMRAALQQVQATVEDSRDRKPAAV